MRATTADLTDGRWFTALIVVSVAALSVLLSGFQYNVYNNAYHIPIALGWLDDPAFRADPLVPTLHLFASPIYRLLTPIATEANLPTLFLLLVMAGRVATFWAFDAIGRSLGIVRPAARAAYLLILATGIGIYNISDIGGDGLLIPYFSHSELAQGVALLSVAEIVRGRTTRALLFAGAAFAINAFIGVWMLVPLGLACLLTDRRLHEAAARTGRAALAFSVVAAPVLGWILAEQAGRPAPPGFDYPAFLAEFFPYHFFIGAATDTQRMLALSQAAAAGVAILMLPLRGRTATVLGGLILVVLAGIVVGETSSNRWLLNLHLMRAAGMVVLVAVPLIVAAALLALADRRIAVAAPATAVLLGVLTASWTYVLPATLVLFAVTRFGKSESFLARSWSLAPLAGAGVILATSLTISTSRCCYGRDKPWDGRSIPTNRELGGLTPSAPHWRDVQLWARRSTPADAMFLVPADLDGFRTGARRPVWITAKDGGAVPWEPALHPLWRDRMAEVAALTSLEGRKRYACARGIDYVVLDGRRPGADFRRDLARYRNAWFAVFASDCRP